MSMLISSKLKAQASEKLFQCLYHPFVVGLASGHLPRENFEAFLLQDAFYLQGFLKAYAYAVTKCKDPNHMLAIVKLMSSVEEELETHWTFLESFGIDTLKVKDISAVEATKNYVDFLVETAKTRTSVAEILASMTPCLRLYAFLGNGIHTASSEQFLASNPYRLWVQTYAAPDFEKAAVTMEKLLDDVAQAENIAYEALIPLYNRAMELELAFFEQFFPLEGGKYVDHLFQHQDVYTEQEIQVFYQNQEGDGILGVNNKTFTYSSSPHPQYETFLKVAQDHTSAIIKIKISGRSSSNLQVEPVEPPKMLPSQSRPLLSHLIAQETSSFHTFSYDEMLCFLHLVNAEKRFEVYTGRSQQDRRIATTQIPPRVLIVAGSDSGGGAGIQADIKACTNVGVFSMTAITAVTVQNSLGVHGIHAIPVATIGDQMTCVLDDLGADVVKIGMLFNEEIIEKVVQVLETRHLPLVLDPVMVATSGHRLLKKAAHTCMVSKLFPLATIITPNALEASALLDDCSIQTLNDMKQAAKKLHPLGPKYVLVKGGHLPCTPDGILRDVLYDGKEFHIIESRFLSTRNTHGTGCTLAAAIAAYYAKSKDMILAVHQAVEYLHGILLRSQDLQLGQGSNGPMLHVKYK